jgi:L-arabinose isomerase
MRFRAKGGPVTLLSVFCDVERFKLVIARGEALPGEPRLLGSPHAVVRIPTPLPEFFEQAIRSGMTQHWALIHAGLQEELVALAEILNLDLLML